MTAYHKLVRDRIPELLDQKGIPYELRIASEDEVLDRLLEKLIEEVREFAEARSPEELGDVIEVISAIKRLPGFENTENLRIKKLLERGGFSKRIILKGNKTDKPL